jgi:hypothetical protein
MDTNITKNSFANLNAIDIDTIENAVRNEGQRQALTEALIEHLKIWENKEWIDSEGLQLLGMRIGNVWPSELKGDLAEEIQNAVTKPASEYFLVRFLVTAHPMPPDHAAAAAPASRAWRIAARAVRPFSRPVATIERMSA